jgi:hypothetical protein
MQRNIACPCGKVFQAEAEDRINFDRNPEYLDQIAGGSFMQFICPGCGKKHKPEFPLMLEWPAKKITFEVLPELDRGEFYRRKKDPPNTEAIISYAELADRIAVIRDGLEPVGIEALKYYLLLKAEESYPDQEISVWYQGRGPEGIEFYLHGIRDGEVAVVRTPESIYEKTMDDYKNHPKGEVFAALKTRSYLSVQNMRRGGQA